MHCKQGTATCLARALDAYVQWNMKNTAYAAIFRKQELRQAFYLYVPSRACGYGDSEVIAQAEGSSCGD